MLVLAEHNNLACKVLSSVKCTENKVLIFVILHEKFPKSLTISLTLGLTLT